MAKLKRLSRGLTFVFGSTLVFGTAAGIVTEANKDTIDGFLGTHSSKLVQKGEGELFKEFTPDSEYLTNGKGDSAKIVKAHEDLCKQIQGEGTVLLKNKDNALPLATSNENKCKVSLFGVRSSATITGAFIGHKAAGNNQTVSFRKALTDAGFDVNTTLADAYDAYVTDTRAAYRNYALAENDFPYQTPYGRGGFNSFEASIDDLTAKNAEVEESISNYNEVGIVVFGRAASEGLDWKKNEVNPDMEIANPMQLTKNEKAILKLAEEKCRKVIVIINAVNQMELQDIVDDEKVSGLLWMGIGGNYATRAVAEILNGTINPSGHLPDTYASYSLSAPATVNLGEYTYANDEDKFTKRLKSSASGRYYVVESEGIYTGYHYYETRYADYINNKGNARSAKGSSYEGNWDYDKEVTFPFGYGMSYSEFDEEFVGSPKVVHEGHKFTLEFKVKVTNKGEKAGKHAVQIYGQAPYVEGGVEKSAIQLLAYGKSKMLEKGESDTLSILVDMQNIASWDSSAKGGNGSYILDSGKYYFAIGNGAHEALNNVFAKQGNSSVKGNANKAYQYNYDIDGVDEDTFNVSKAGVQVKNSLEGADFNHYAPNTVTHLSRSDWSGTWPKEYTGLTATDEMLKIINGGMYTVSTSDDTTGITFGKAGEKSYISLKGAPYSYDEWDDVLDQLDLTQALNFILHGNRSYTEMASVGFLGGTFTENGPNGVGDRSFTTLSFNNYGENVSKCEWHIDETDPNAKFEMRVFPSAPVMAATFNPELANAQGRLMGNDALFVGLPILWGPSMNTHRTGYNGRNIEYYSEDPVLTGTMGMEYSVGALDKGLICAPKHFAFNDQETHRDGVSPYLTEQRGREIELRAFQIAFEASKYDTEDNDVGLLGVMTSFSKIGPCEVTCSKGLITDILRGEWGYKGYIVSDLNDDEDYFAQALAAGMTSFDSTDTIDVEKLSFFDVESIKKDATILNNIKEAVHRNLWVLTKSNYMNVVNANTEMVSNMTWWRAAYISIIAASGALMALSLAGAIFTSVKDGKKKEEN